MTRIVLLLDGYAAFAATYERVHFGDVVQTVTRLAAEGRSLGIHVVISADRRADVPGALAGVISGRIVLRMADDDDYATLGIGRNAVAGDALPPGRGFTREGTLVQVAHVASGRYEELCRELAAAWPDGHARPVGRLRSSIERGDLPAPSAPLRAVVGIEDEQLAPVEIDLSGDSFLVAGPHRSGRSTALATIAASLWRGGGPPVHLLVPRRSPLARLDGWADVARGPEACLTSAGRLAAAAGPLVVVIDDAEELAEGAAAAPLGELLRRGRDEQVRLVAAVEGRAAQRLFGGWLRDLRGAQHGLLLQAESDVDGDLLGVRLPRRGPASLPPGRGWLAQEGLVRLVQVAWDGPSASAGQ